MTNHRANSILFWLRRIAITAAGTLFAGSLAAAGTSKSLDPLLNRTGDLVTQFLNELSDVQCTEVVSQDKLEKNNKVEYAETSTFDYVVLAQSKGGEPLLAESRLLKQAPKHKRSLSLMVSNGFSVLLLIFHPYYRPSFEFTLQGEDRVDGKRYERVQFKHIRGLRSTSALLVQGREYPLDLQGMAWIDPKTGTVSRIDADLEAPMDDIGLHAVHTEVLYAPVAFQGVQNAYWLPSRALVDVESPHQHWRNVHQFMNYHRFSTSVVETRAGKQP